MKTFERVTPEARGVSSRAVLKFLDKVAADGHEVHSFMLLKDGAVLCEKYWAPFNALGRNELYSLSKSFTSIGVGIAVDEGLLTLDDKVVDIFKDEAASLGAKMDEKMARTTVRHLLTMSTGQEYENWQGNNSVWDAPRPEDDMNNIKGFLTAHVKNEPGTAFFYHTLATYMLSAAITRLTGQKLVDWLKPRLFDPLGIVEPYWREDEDTGVSTGGFGLNIRTEDIARFGQFLLQKGVWEGKRLVSEAYIDMATAKQVENGANDGNDWGSGYGFQFWRCEPDGVYRGDGMFGQLCAIEQATNTAVIATSNVDLGKFFKEVWVLLDDLKTMKPDESDGSAERLAAIGGLTAMKVNPSAQSYPVFRAEYRFENARYGGFAVDFDGTECSLIVFDGKKRPGWAYTFRNGEVVRASAPYSPENRFYSRVATTGEWSDGVFTAVIRYYELPDYEAVRITFNADRTEAVYEEAHGGFDAKFEKIAAGRLIK